MPIHALDAKLLHGRQAVFCAYLINLPSSPGICTNKHDSPGFRNTFTSSLSQCLLRCAFITFRLLIYSESLCALFHLKYEGEKIENWSVVSLHCAHWAFKHIGFEGASDRFFFFLVLLKLIELNILIVFRGKLESILRSQCIFCIPVLYSCQGVKWRKCGFILIHSYSETV